MQHVSANAELDWDIVDHGWSAHLRADRAKGFDLTKPPLARCSLQRGADCIRFAFTFHHAILDGRSLRRLFIEAFGHDTAESPPYRSFVEWLSTRDRDGDETFWREYLDGFDTPTMLSQRAGLLKAEDHAAHAEHDVRLSPDLSGRLRELARRHDMTLNTLMQGAWGLLLAHYTGHDDVVFGATRSVRRDTVPGAEEMVGLFFNTLPVRTRPVGDRLLLDYLGELRRHAVAVRDHQHTPLMEIQRLSCVSQGRPLFDTLLTFENRLLGEALRAQGGLWSKRKFEMRRQPSYPMALVALAEPAVLLTLVHDRRFFAPDVVDCLGEHLKHLLETFVAMPEARIRDLPRMAATDKTRVLRDWNATAADFPRGLRAHEFIERHAALDPDALAISGGSRTLSYGELDVRANRVARALADRGAGREMLVGVCAERGPELVVAELGVLKSGAAYLPLDPASPTQRLAAVLAAANVRLVLADRDATPRLPDGVEVLETEKITAGPGQPLGVSVAPRNLAYVTCTSGSTGEPKFVGTEHAGLTNLITWLIRSHALTTADRTTLVANPAFDGAVMEMWPCLGAGASVHVPTRDVLLSPALLANWLASEEITVGFLPTGLAELVIDQPWPEHSKLRVLRTGGDRLHGPKRRLPFDLSNLYGPAEYTSVTTASVTGSGAAFPPLPPIGCPIDNTQTYVLDAGLTPVPIGAPGELCIAGIGLARGYIGRPAATADRFRPNPFGTPGSRMYLSGDQARHQPGGALEFLGRTDRQVQVRGFRVEPGEVEAALRAHPAVTAAVVLASPDPGGGQRLIAFAVAAGELPTAEVYDHLRASLPQHMVPARLIPMPEVPLTVNGKPDRDALLACLAEETQAPEPAQMTPLQAMIAETWGQALGARIGLHDDFFKQGGHSLHVVAATLRLGQQLEADLPAIMVVEAPTVAEYAIRLEDFLKSSVRSPGIALLARP
jgi:microcystin synthetase protein McyB